MLPRHSTDAPPTCGSPPSPSTSPCSNPALARLGETELRRQVLEGGYRLLDWQTATPRGRPGLTCTYRHLPASCCPKQWRPPPCCRPRASPSTYSTSPARAASTKTGAPHSGDAGQSARPSRLLSWLIPPDQRQAPIVTVQDGASHNLAWLGSLFGSYLIPPRRRRLRPVRHARRPLPPLRNRQPGNL